VFPMFCLPRLQVTIEKVTKKLNGRTFTPSVIEPSFGIGRIIYCMFEHVFYTREASEASSPLVSPLIISPRLLFPALFFPALFNPSRPSVLRSPGCTPHQ